MLYRLSYAHRRKEAGSVVILHQRGKNRSFRVGLPGCVRSLDKLDRKNIGIPTTNPELGWALLWLQSETVARQFESRGRRRGCDCRGHSAGFGEFPGGVGLV